MDMIYNIMPGMQDRGGFSRLLMEKGEGPPFVVDYFRNLSPKHDVWNGHLRQSGPPIYENLVCPPLQEYT